MRVAIATKNSFNLSLNFLTSVMGLVLVLAKPTPRAMPRGRFSSIDPMMKPIK